MSNNKEELLEELAERLHASDVIKDLSVDEIVAQLLKLRKTSKPKKKKTSDKKTSAVKQMDDDEASILITKVIKKFTSGTIQMASDYHAYGDRNGFSIVSAEKIENKYIHLKWRLNKDKSTARTIKDPGTIILFINNRTSSVWDFDKSDEQEIAARCIATDEQYNALRSLFKKAVQRVKEAEAAKKAAADANYVKSVVERRKLICEALELDPSLAEYSYLANKDVSEADDSDLARQDQLIDSLFCSGRIAWETIALFKNEHDWYGSYSFVVNLVRGVSIGVCYNDKRRELNITVDQYRRPSASASAVFRVLPGDHTAIALIKKLHKKRVDKEAAEQEERIRAAEEARRAEEKASKESFKRVVEFLSK